jgi:hypothetical protein
MPVWFTKLQIRFAFWLLRLSIPRPQKRALLCRLQNTVGDGLDPCQLFIDAVESTLTQIESHQLAMEELAPLWVDQMDALADCRAEHPE